ncbi:MAG TPA: HNH endonuclease signature motif containing protein [Bryobacteraceae bacterium]|jgi:hypothetical protein|nr:HNH endonuclease signature motif containing protein [Bryobacteraceae bacterium]
MNGRFWSEGDIERLRELYPHQRTDRVAEALNRTVCAVYGTAQKLGLSKTEEFLRSPESGQLQEGMTRPESVPHQFKKGLVPANKGTRRPGWAPGRMAETQFKKGAISGKAKTNQRPIGTILTDHEGYLRIKVRERNKPTEVGWHKDVWPLLHHVVWTRTNGPIPPKHMVVFRDRDRSNCVIENLEMITMAECARRNRMWHNMPRELAQAIQLQGVLKRKLRKHSAKEQSDGPSQPPFRNAGSAEGQGQPDGSQAGAGY